MTNLGTSVLVVNCEGLCTSRNKLAAGTFAVSSVGFDGVDEAGFVAIRSVVGTPAIFVVDDEGAGADVTAGSTGAVPSAGEFENWAVAVVAAGTGAVTVAGVLGCTVTVVTCGDDISANNSANAACRGEPALSAGVEAIELSVTAARSGL